MPLSFGQFEKYLVQGVRVTMEIGDESEIERQVRQLESKARLVEKASIAVDGILASELTDDAKRTEWGALLFYLKFRGLDNRTDVTIELATLNEELIVKIEEDHVQAASLVSEFGESRFYTEDELRDIIWDPGLHKYYKEFPTLNGILKVVKREVAADYLVAVERVAAELAEPSNTPKHSGAPNIKVAATETNAVSPAENKKEVRSYLKKLQDLARKGFQALGKIDVLNVAVSWDREAYEKGIVLEDVVTEFEVKKQDVHKLDPIQLSALVVQTLPDRVEREDLTLGEHLYLLTETLHSYQSIDFLTGGYKQRDALLRFFRETIPGMIMQSGYRPALTHLEIIDQEVILPEETEQVLSNLRTDVNTSDALQTLYTFEGAREFIQTEDEELNVQIHELAWKSVARLIEKRGYQRLDKIVERLIPDPVDTQKRIQYHAALLEEDAVQAHAETFPTGHDTRYVAPQGIAAIGRTIRELVEGYEMPLAEKHERLVRNLVEHRNRRNYAGVEEDRVKLQDLGFDHWSLNLLIASSESRQVGNVEVINSVKHTLPGQVETVVGKYVSAMDGHRIAGEFREVIEQDCKSLRNLANRARAQWGDNDKGAIKISRQVRDLETATQEAAKGGVLNFPFTIRKDKQLEMVKRAIAYESN